MSFIFFLFTAVAHAQTGDLCALKDKDVKSDDTLGAEIRKAISAEQRLVELSLVSFSPVTEGQLHLASQAALQSAFRRILEQAIKERVPASRRAEVASLVERKILEKPRVFILNFRKLKSAVCDEKEYRIMVKATLKLHELEKAVLKEGIIQLEFSAKKIRISNVSRAKDYLAIRDLLQRRIPNLKRLVEIYQKRGEVEFLIETPAGWDEIRTRLVTEPGESGNIPKFQLLYDEKKGLELKLL
ncbi:MAG: hypothetical protein AAB309_04480 [Deltaproteobacteria bacterium]